MSYHGTPVNFGDIFTYELIYRADDEEPIYNGLDSATAAKYTAPTGSTSQYVRGDGSLATFPAATSRTFSTPSRSVNTAFQISTTQDTSVSYSVDITTALSLTTGSAGTVYLEYADNSGFTTNVKEVGHFTTSNTGTLVVGLALNQIATAQLNGLIPAGKYVRLRTNNITGTPTYGTPASQEVLL